VPIAPDRIIDPGRTLGRAAESNRAEPDSTHLLRGAASLASNTAVTSALGFIFWVLAARLFTSSELGRDTVLISAMIELSTVCQLNLGNAIVRFLPTFGRAAPRALRAAYGAATSLAILVGTAFVLLAPRLSSEFAFLRQPGLQVGFVLALALWGIFALQDASLTAARRATWIPIENGVFGALKIVALVPAALLSLGHGIFLSWTVPMALLVGPVNWLIFTRVLRGRAGEGDLRDFGALGGRRKAGVFLAQDYLASLFTQATLTLLPILVLAILGPEASAWFAVPFMIVVAFDTLAYGTCTALVAEAATRPSDASKLARVFVKRVIAPLVPATLALIAVAPLILHVFGPAYAEHGTTVLRLLLGASMLRFGVALFAALARIRGRALKIVAVEFALLVLALGAAIPLAHADGIDGVAIAWLGANLLALVFITPSLRSELR
jgi:O-antigen/teichoic acid export membrane protein